MTAEVDLRPSHACTRRCTQADPRACTPIHVCTHAYLCTDAHTHTQNLNRIQMIQRAVEKKTVSGSLTQSRHLRPCQCISSQCQKEKRSKFYGPERTEHNLHVEKNISSRKILGFFFFCNKKVTKGGSGEVALWVEDLLCKREDWNPHECQWVWCPACSSSSILEVEIGGPLSKLRERCCVRRETLPRYIR